jgi:hypothetical protein
LIICPYENNESCSPAKERRSNMTGKTPVNMNSASIYSDESGAILHQAVSLIKQVVGFDISIASDGKSFRSVAGDSKRHSGIQAAAGRLDESILSIKLEVLRLSKICKVDPEALFGQLSELGERTRISQPEITDTLGTQLWVEMKVDPKPMSLSRSAVILEELKKIDAIARSLQNSLPEIADESGLEKLYGEFSEFLDPVIPAGEKLLESNPEMGEWTEKTAAYLDGMLSVAISSPHELMREYAVACIARRMMRSGQSLGLVKVPAINSKSVLELAAKAPGIVVVPVDRLRMGTNIYETASEVLPMLSVLRSEGHCAIFTGTYDQLQETFHGGQGGESDPLYPVVRHIPEMPSEDLLRHVIETRSRQMGGMSAESKSRLFESVCAALQKMPVSQRIRLVRPLTNRQMKLSGPLATDAENTENYACSLGDVQETLGGLCGNGSVERPKHIQRRFTDIMVESDLLSMFKSELMAQDNALEQLARRLKTECLTRPLNQPIRYCAQGTPATGKSRSAALLAEYLRVPFINIDAASMPNFYTASAQLLGSGRGIVGSHRSGRLEQAARHYSGAVVEISDLDHAVPEVRGSLADLFLQVLETGQAQSATGAMFSCANLIFAFTINLPNGMDEAVHKTFGFGAVPPEDEVRKRVVGEIKNLFSTAFLSRIGSPIMFEPLDGNAIELIIERTVESAIESVLERLAIDSGRVVIKKSLGKMIASSIDSTRESFGARLLIEHSRALVAESLSRLRECCARESGDTLFVDYDGSRELIFSRK